jgi:hypothetical protein
MSPYFLFQGPSNFTQNGIFDLKTNHLAALLGRTKSLSQQTSKGCQNFFLPWTKKEIFLITKKRILFLHQNGNLAIKAKN